MEMGGNAIEWGHRKNADLVLPIVYRIDPEAVTLIIRDQGPGFNPGKLPHAASDEDPIGHLDIRNDLGIREGGFGIMLAKGLVDEFHYNDKGNEVTLIKRFEASPKVDRALRVSDASPGRLATPWSVGCVKRTDRAWTDATGAFHAPSTSVKRRSPASTSSPRRRPTPPALPRSGGAGCTWRPGRSARRCRS